MGVKQLWTLLGPVGRPVLLDAMEGKAMAIDSSIWIYQFQATMRDKDGRALVNAHVLGFLRRICKLLFYGIKPVFVFDGGAPTLKRTTIAERKRKKAGAADNHVRVAEKLLAAQLRREAINQVQKAKAKATAPAPIVNEDTVYLEDLLNNTPQVSPSKGKEKEKVTSESPSKKVKFHDHDPYRLPEVDLGSITKPTSSMAPDPRLATEEELRFFIESMRPEDFDVTSPAFNELPTEVQYEIIGDLRLKSRQTSHKRLQSMLKNSSSPLDFSKAQIRHLQQRNALTQQLLVTTDSISKANVLIPVRIASERNKEYVLIKNEGSEGGWILGIQNEGTQDKPIVLDDSERTVEDDDSDGEMEEISISKYPAPDPDLREYHGRMALAAVTRRQPPSSRPIPHPSAQTQKKVPTPMKRPLLIEADPDLEAAIQESLREQEEESVQQAIEASIQVNATIDTIRAEQGEEADEDDDLYEAGPSRLETALSFANTPNRRTFSGPLNSPGKGSLFGIQTLLLPEKPSSASGTHALEVVGDSDDDDMEEVVESSIPSQGNSQMVNFLAPAIQDASDEDLYEDLPGPAPNYTNMQVEFATDVTPMKQDKPPLLSNMFSTYEPSTFPVNPSAESRMDEVVQIQTPVLSTNKQRAGSDIVNVSPGVVGVISPAELSADISTNPFMVDVSDEEALDDWERPSTPLEEELVGGPKNPPAPKNTDEAWDAAQEMDVVAEEGDFAEFLSQMKGQDLEIARQEIDNEILNLNKQKKAAMRDSEDITQHMISQIMLMLRLFGIPYITAPMEAEAQCATLVSLGLVEGVITDDSDVFLFGGLRVFKNMFNQSKTVECFLLTDLARELGLDQDKLIRLAYLLGSDYVEGLPGVGPVVAMELLKEFPAENGLHKFKEWWRKVQSGKDTEVDNQSAFRKRFKKRFKDLYLPEDWPNPAVRDAYYHPAVDGSEEQFKWGLPDLDALRQFLQDELSWSQSKVDDLLVPIIRKMGQRSQNTTANRQGVLDNYLEIPVGGASSAPRRRQAYASKRLQKVVADFRAAHKNGQLSAAPQNDTNDDSIPPAKKRKTKSTSKGGAGAGKCSRGGKTSRKQKETSSSSDDDTGNNNGGSVAGVPKSSDIPAPAEAVKLRRRPKPKYKAVESEDDGLDGSNDEFVVKRSRRKL